MTYILEKRESQISIKAPWILTILERSVKDFPKRKKGILCCITSIYKIIFLQYTAINILTFFVSNENSDRIQEMNLLLITLVNEMAQHDRHDQLSTTWLLDTGIGYQSFAPKVSAHYEGENILCDNQCSKQKKKRIRILWYTQ